MHPVGRKEAEVNPAINQLIFVNRIGSSLFCYWGGNDVTTSWLSCWLEALLYQQIMRNTQVDFTDMFLAERKTGIQISQLESHSPGLTTPSISPPPKMSVKNCTWRPLKTADTQEDPNPKRLPCILTWNPIKVEKSPAWIPELLLSWLSVCA